MVIPGQRTTVQLNGDRATVAEGVDDDLVIGDEVVHQGGVEGVTGAQRHPVHPLFRHPGEVLDHRAHRMPAEDQIGDDQMPRARVGPEDHHPHGVDAISGVPDLEPDAAKHLPSFLRAAKDVGS
ncbi:hypothetical protein [Kocuria kalidii]|uniref:hypothetical protein n=1 Tax=Kocuria kalidii TaxID=3376283 RepID=UPI0037A99E1E